MSTVTVKRKRSERQYSVAEEIFAELNQQEIVENYIYTRHIDDVSAKDIFAQEFENVTQPVTVLDVGCGVGRLAIPIAQNFKHADITGIDTSESMILYATKRQQEKGIPNDRLRFINISVLSFPHLPPYNNIRFDYVICHWCFHCIRPWRSALLACINLTKPNTGKLLWLTEEGSLYLALDNLSDSTGTYQVDRPRQWQYFWKTYHDKRDRIESYARADHRLGTVLRCTDDLERFLKPLGWTVRSEGGPVKWKKSESYEDLVQKYLLPRAFTNLQRIPPEKNVTLIDDLRSTIGSSDVLDWQDRVNLNYEARLFAGYSDTRFLDKTQNKFKDAALSILDCSREIYYDALDLSDFAARRPEALLVLREILKTFFSSLFNPQSIPLWQHFWKPDAEDTCPEWVWIRLPRKPAANFKRFLEDHLWAHTNIENLFQDDVLRAYFKSDATFAHLARSTRKEFWRPILVEIKPDSFNFEIPSSDYPDLVQLVVPDAFVNAYCAEPYNPSVKFERRRWEVDTLSHRTTLFRKFTGEGEQTWKEKLETFGRELDKAFGVTTYEQEPELFVRMLQSMRLFPGTYYYFFPVRRATGEIVSSISFATANPLTNPQVKMLIRTVDSLLTVSSLVIRLVKPK